MKENEIIAEFMGAGNWYEAQSSNQFNHYHTDWNSLMTVVDKIESSGYIVAILHHGTMISGEFGAKVDNLNTNQFKNRIDYTYDAVVKFIKCENTYTKKTYISWIWLLMNLIKR